MKLEKFTLRPECPMCGEFVSFLGPGPGVFKKLCIGNAQSELDCPIKGRHLHVQCACGWRWVMETKEATQA